MQRLFPNTTTSKELENKGFDGGANIYFISNIFILGFMGCCCIFKTHFVVLNRQGHSAYTVQCLRPGIMGNNELCPRVPEHIRGHGQDKQS